MNDDIYELVPKEFVKKLKNENKELKEELEKLKQELILVKKEKGDSAPKKIVLDDEVLFQIQEISKEEKKVIVEYLDSIKQNTEQMLDKTLSRTETLNKKTEDLINTIRDLVINLTEILDNLESKNDIGDEFSYIKSIINELNSSASKHNVDIIHIEQKLTEIEDFMTKLKILLSQIKPADMVLKK
jgi:hypothetical protein